MDLIIILNNTDKCMYSIARFLKMTCVKLAPLFPKIEKITRVLIAPPPLLPRVLEFSINFRNNSVD